MPCPNNWAMAGNPGKATKMARTREDNANGLIGREARMTERSPILEESRTVKLKGNRQKQRLLWPVVEVPKVSCAGCNAVRKRNLKALALVRFLPPTVPGAARRVFYLSRQGTWLPARPPRYISRRRSRQSVDIPDTERC